MLSSTDSAPAKTNGASAEKKDKARPSSNGSASTSKATGDMLREKGGVGTNK